MMISAENSVVRRVTWVGATVNVCLSLLKLLTGWLGHSQVVIADGVHSLSDLSTDVVILVGVRYWGRPADESHPHGHRRIETLVTLSIGLFLVAVATGLLCSALLRLAGDSFAVPGALPLVAAVVSVVSKEILYRWTAAHGRRVRSMPLIANALHQRSDALSSMPAVVAVAASVLVPRLAFLDSVGTAAVSLFIYHAALKVLLPALAKLVDSGADAATRDRILSIAQSTDGVRDVHGVRTRYVGCYSLSVDLHIEVPSEMTVKAGHDISEQVKQRLLEGEESVVDVVVHLEPHESVGQRRNWAPG